MTDPMTDQMTDLGGGTQRANGIPAPLAQVIVLILSAHFDLIQRLPDECQSPIEMSPVSPQ